MVSAAQNQVISATLTPAALGSAISTAVADKTLQAARQEGAGVLALIDQAGAAGQEAGGQAGDPLVAKATGLGGLLDVVG